MCGVEYTSKFQKMFTDMSLNRELAPKFSAFMAASTDPKSTPEFSVQVLTNGEQEMSAATQQPSLMLSRVGFWILPQSTITVATPADCQRLIEKVRPSFWGCCLCQWHLTSVARARAV
jgi:hypothetical protein